MVIPYTGPLCTRGGLRNPRGRDSCYPSPSHIAWRVRTVMRAANAQARRPLDGLAKPISQSQFSDFLTYKEWFVTTIFFLNIFFPYSFWKKIWKINEWKITKSSFESQTIYRIYYSAQTVFLPVLVRLREDAKK